MKQPKKVSDKIFPKTATGIFDMFADKDGFISLNDLAKVGWSKARAEDEGLIIKENFKPVMEKE